MEIKLLRPTDIDYPIIMKLVPFADKYDLMKIDGLTVVPLIQVIDTIASVKADIDVINGIECCPTCGKPIKGIFTKADMVAMLTELQLEIEKSPCKHSDRLGDYSDGVQKGIDVIQEKINALKENTNEK